MARSPQAHGANAVQTPASGGASAPSDVLVFVEDAAVAEASLRHAQRVASAYSGKVVLVHVQCRADPGAAPVDPVEWDLRRQQSLKWLMRLTRLPETQGVPCEAKLLEGHCITQIQSFLEGRQGDIAATVRCRDSNGWQSSDTASGVMLSHSESILIIPEVAQIAGDHGYRRVLVPLDGSARAETALPKAVMLALAQAAELVLCHVTPEPGLTPFGVRDHEADRLNDMVRKRNEQAGKTYLGRIKNSLAQSGLKVATAVTGNGDARRGLIDAISRQKADFVVMATHGQGGHSDVPTGDVARFVLDRAEVPVLLVRHAQAGNGRHAFDKVTTAGVRQPTGTC